MESLSERFPDVDAAAWSLLKAWAALLREWNARVNLVSRKDIAHLETRHLAPCLAITRHLRLMRGARVLDAGTGGGLPGLPMAICYPQAHFTLLDSTRKKVDAVAATASELGLKNVTTRVGRAEAFHREFDFVTGRAVKNLPVFLGWVRDNVRRGARNSLANGVLYWKGGDFEEELAAAGIRPRHIFEADVGEDAAGKRILHFDARDLPRLRAGGRGR